MNIFIANQNPIQAALYVGRFNCCCFCFSVTFVLLFSRTIGLQARAFGKKNSCSRTITKVFVCVYVSVARHLKFKCTSRNSKCISSAMRVEKCLTMNKWADVIFMNLNQFILNYMKQPFPCLITDAYFFRFISSKWEIKKEWFAVKLMSPYKQSLSKRSLNSMKVSWPVIYTLYRIRKIPQDILFFYSH